MTFWQIPSGIRGNFLLSRRILLFKNDNYYSTSTIEFLSLDEIPLIPGDRVVTYARIVVDFRPQKEDPNRVRITVGGNLIDYPYELTTRTADLTASKVMWNLVISTRAHNIQSPTSRTST